MQVVRSRELNYSTNLQWKSQRDHSRVVRPYEVPGSTGNLLVLIFLYGRYSIIIYLLVICYYFILFVWSQINQ